MTDFNVGKLQTEMTFHCIWFGKIMEFCKNLFAVIQMVEVKVSSVMWFIAGGRGGGFPP